MTGSGARDDRSVGLIVAAAGGLLAFVVLTGLMLAHVSLGFDQPLLQAAESIRGDGTVWRVISESANIPLIVIGVGMVLILLARRHFRHAILVALLLLAVTVGSEGVKQLVARPRPSGTDPNIPGVVYSYPSGHVLESLVIFGMIAVEIVRRGVSRAVAVLVFALVAIDVILVAVSRVALAAHYPSDALAAMLAGIGVLSVYAWLRRPAASPGRSPGRSA